MENSMLAGTMGDAVLALIFVVYLLFRGKAVIAFFQNLDESIARMPERELFAVILVGFLGASLVFGGLSGLVYGWVGSGQTFTAIGLGLAMLFSILAAVRRTPLMSDKIVWNFAVGGVLGVLVPFFASI